MIFSNSKNPFLCLLLTVVVLLSSCHGSTPDTEQVPTDSVPEAEEEFVDSLMLYDDEPEPETADMLFADFFYAFTTDSRYQSQRVNFPLSSAKGDGESMTQAEWEERGAFEPQEFYAVIYDRETDMAAQNDTSVNAVAVDHINLLQQTMDRYHFQRVQGKWMLTDYDAKSITHSPQGSFLEFYSQFANDTLFQRQSIDFPLRLVSEAGDEEEGGETELTEEEWPEFRDQMPLPTSTMTAIDYGQAALSENRKILLMEGLSNSLFVKYKFDRTDGRWQLYEIDF